MTREELYRLSRLDAEVRNLKGYMIGMANHKEAFVSRQILTKEAYQNDECNLSKSAQESMKELKSKFIDDAIAIIQHDIDCKNKEIENA